MYVRIDGVVSRMLYSQCSPQAKRGHKVVPKSLYHKTKHFAMQLAGTGRKTVRINE